LTAEDRASPIPNDVIDDGNCLLEEMIDLPNVTVDGQAVPRHVDTAPLPPPSGTMRTEITVNCQMRVLSFLARLPPGAALGAGGVAAAGAVSRASQLVTPAAPATRAKAPPPMPLDDVEREQRRDRGVDRRTACHEDLEARIRRQRVRGHDHELLGGGHGIRCVTGGGFRIGLRLARGGSGHQPRASKAIRRMLSLLARQAGASCAASTSPPSTSARASGIVENPGSRADTVGRNPAPCLSPRGAGIGRRRSASAVRD
jgi:hypothetical protein